MMRFHVVLFWVLCTGWAFQASGQQVTRVQVTTEVIRAAEEFEPLGLNNFGDPGGTRHSAGNLIFNPGFEPITQRDLYRVIDSGQENGRYWITLDGPGTSRYLLYTSGTYSGAEMRAYRFVDDGGNPAPYKEAGWAQGGKILDAEKASRLVPLFTTRVTPRGAPGLPDGGWTVPGVPDSYSEWSSLSKEQQEQIARGWRVYYEGGEQLRLDDVVIFQRTFHWPDLNDFHPRVRRVGSPWSTTIGQIRQVPFSGGRPEELYGSLGVLEMMPDSGVAQVWNKLFGGPGRRDANWYSTLEPGVSYRYEAWVRREGGSHGTVILGFGPERPDALQRGYFGHRIQHEQAVGESWQLVGFEFVAPTAPANGGIEGAVIRYEGDGKLLVDNVRLQAFYEPEQARQPFVVNRRLLNEMLASQPSSGRKGAVRIWAGLTEGTMAALCSWIPDNSLRFSDRVSVRHNDLTTVAKALTILEQTGDNPETRCVPWIMTQITHTEEEYRQLIEYLCAPYDPQSDTPDSKPMAYQRWRQRGHGRPWSADFREIIIEFGNENWHNRKMEGWIGLGRYGTVHQAGREFGIWARYMVDQMRQSPWWDDQKLTICLGGNYTAEVRRDGTVRGYGQEATIAAGGANRYHSHATYIGPRWETGESSQTTIDDGGIQRTLLAYRLAKDEEWNRQAQAHKRLREMGLDVRMSAYEGGPSGFGLRAESPEQDRAAEYYGKSRAMGIAMLDAWLDAWRLGWTYQCYLSFGQGRWWNSHTSYAQGFRPSPGFLALKLVNHTVANRNLVRVEVDGSPTLELDLPRSQSDVRANRPAQKRTVNLIHAHAAMDDQRTVVALVNLDLASPHTVELQLPFSAARQVIRHGMTGDPRDTNLEELKVETHTTALEHGQFSNGRLTLTLEPGDGCILEFLR